MANISKIDNLLLELRGLKKGEGKFFTKKRRKQKKMLLPQIVRENYS